MNKINSFVLIFILFIEALIVIADSEPRKSLEVKTTKLTSKMVVYGDQEKFEGYAVCAEESKEGKPGVLIAHQWLAILAETTKQADRFAALGYVVFAIDVYGKDTRPKSIKDAVIFSTKYKSDRNLFRERLILGLEELKKQKNVDVARLAVVGYCFGGTAAIELGRSGASLLGIISFHGGLDSPKPADGKNIKAKVLALCGAIDPFVAPKDIIAFEDEMNVNQVDYQIVRYGGTVHSFTEEGAGNDTAKGAAYNKSSDLKSFHAAEDFLAEVFNFSKSVR